MAERWKKVKWEMPELPEYEVVEDDAVVAGPFASKKAAEIERDRRDAEFDYQCKFRVRPVEKERAA